MWQDNKTRPVEGFREKWPLQVAPCPSKAYGQSLHWACQLHMAQGENCSWRDRKMDTLQGHWIGLDMVIFHRRLVWRESIKYSATAIMKLVRHIHIDGIDSLLSNIPWRPKFWSITFCEDEFWWNKESPFLFLEKNKWIFLQIIYFLSGISYIVIKILISCLCKSLISRNVSF